MCFESARELAIPKREFKINTSTFFRIFSMAGSLLLLAKGALVALVRSVAVAYGVQVTCNQDSSDAVIISNFRKVAFGKRLWKFRCAVPKVHVISGLVVCNCKLG